MVDILWIGQYNEEGRFTQKQWNDFLKWCERICDEILIYTRITYDAIHWRFPRYCDIRIQEKPDELSDIQSYQIDIKDVRFWEYIDTLNFDIDIADEISHLFFFKHKQHIASLEIGDDQNYVLFEDSIPVDERLTLPKKLALENVQLCINGKYDIDDLVQSEELEIIGSEVVS